MQVPLAGADGFELARQFGPDGTSSSSFGGTAVDRKFTSIAIDQTAGLVYVLDQKAGTLFKFDTDGNPVDFGGSSANLSGNEMYGLPLEVAGSGGEGTVVAVNQVTHTIYVTAESGGQGGTEILAFTASGEPSNFTAGSGAGSNVLSTAPTAIAGLTSDSTGAIWVALRTYSNPPELVEAHISVFAASGAEILPEVKAPVFGNSSISATDLVVDEDGFLYLASGGSLTKYEPSEYPVTATTTHEKVASAPSGSIPGQIKGLDLNAATKELYAAIAGPGEPGIAVFDFDLNPLTSFARSGEEGELGNPTGVGVDPVTERIFVPDSPEGALSQVKVFQPERCVCAPAIVVSGITNVTSDSAKVLARINPDGFETTYWVEYGTADCQLNPCEKVPLSGGLIGTGFKPVAVSQVLTGLKAETLYHYRVVAENELDTTVGPDKTFTTQGSGLGFKLADWRVWEIVSPPDKHGGSLVLPYGGLIQAAEDGNALTYLSLGSVEARPEGNRAVESASVLASRGASGWRSLDITPPHIELTNVRPENEYRLMAPDLSRALLQARDAAPLSPFTTERAPYLRENSEPAVYTPLLTSAEGHANVPPGTEWEQNAPSAGENVHAVGANPNLSTIALQSKLPLTEGGDVEEEAIYGWQDGRLQAISQLPALEGGAVISGSLGSGGSVRNAVSADGSRLFWAPGHDYNASGVNLPALYLRDTSLEESVRLDVVEDGASGGGAPRPAFQGASSDGTVVFFTDSRHLTKDASPEGRDLYRCQIPGGQSLGGCAVLTDLSAPSNGSGESAMVLDQAPAFSEDGSRIYFVAEGVVDTRPNGEGDTAAAAEPNLYLWEEGAGVRFIAQLSEEDSPAWGKFNDVGLAARVTADASPNGRYLAFMSERSLTGYDNGEANTGELAEEAYRYDAVAEVLTCISCSPTGGSPQAQLLHSEGRGLMVDPAGLWQERWAAATLPEPRTATGFQVIEAFYRPRAALEDGRVFFNAYDSLVPADTNRGWDVYQFEPAGVGDCTASTGGAAVVRSGGGCVALISSGDGEEESAFLDSSSSGDDAFFLSTAKLSALDEDSVYDVYDARVNGVAAQRPTIAECQGETCQSAVPAPNDLNPSSAVFHGAGNVRHCPKGKRAIRRKGVIRCVARKKRHQSHRKHRRHHHNRRAAR
jgi:DNA-binding beta-propeller fold protein YncE